MNAGCEAVVGSPIADVTFEKHRILVRLDDGRTLAAPPTWAGPTVLAMSAEERAGWVHTPDRRGVNWTTARQTSADGAINVWQLEQDALFDEALAKLRASEYDATALDERSRAVVSLWRLTADGYNGGLLQFLGNWGIVEVEVALRALRTIHASATLAVVSEFWDALRPIAEADDVSTMDDVFTHMSDDLSAALEGLDRRFWEAADELTRLVPLAYGPAPSVLDGTIVHGAPPDQSKTAEPRQSEGSHER